MPLARLSLDKAARVQEALALGAASPIVPLVD